MVCIAGWGGSSLISSGTLRPVCRVPTSVLAKWSGIAWSGATSAYNMDPSPQSASDSESNLCQCPKTTKSGDTYPVAKKGEHLLHHMCGKSTSTGSASVRHTYKRLAIGAGWSSKTACLFDSALQPQVGADDLHNACTTLQELLDCHKPASNGNPGRWSHFCCLDGFIHFHNMCSTPPKRSHRYLPLQICFNTLVNPCAKKPRVSMTSPKKPVLLSITQSKTQIERTMCARKD